MSYSLDSKTSQSSADDFSVTGMNFSPGTSSDNQTIMIVAAIVAAVAFYAISKKNRR